MRENVSNRWLYHRHPSHTYLHTDTQTYAYKLVHKHTCAQALTHTYIICMDIFTHTHILVHTHTHEFILIHTRAHNYIDFYPNPFHIPFHNDNNCYKDKVNKGDCVRSKRCIPKTYISYDNYDRTFQILKILILLILSHYGTSYFHIHVLFLFFRRWKQHIKSSAMKKKKML